jgi:cysteine synthase A
MNVYQNITETIGRTPLVKINNIVKENAATILAKIEAFNPGSCVKERIALSMINAAEEAGELEPGGTIVEPTSGNTGIGLALVAAARGYKLVITMPESMSVERRKIIAHFGAKIILTPAAEGMTGAINKAVEIHKDTPGSFLAQQFSNPANPQAHYTGTGPEIWADTDGKVDIFVAGVGTGGTLSGVAQYLKEQNSDIEVVAVEPERSPVISGGNPGPHAIQGIGAGFIPENLHTELITETIKVSDDDAIQTARKLAKEEGLLVGISCGAAMKAALEVARRPENKEKTVVVILPDTGERYLTTSLFSE